MKNFYLILILILLNVSCKKEVKIERFVWIQHNQNWIWNPDDLRAIFYVEYLDSCNKIKFAHSGKKLSEYYISKSPDSLKSLIIKNLYLKKFSPCYPTSEDTRPYIYSGFNYCIIYKFKDQPEKILNYIPPAVPDSLTKFIDYLKQLPNLKSYTTTQPFDNASLFNEYRYKIISCGPISPPPAPDSIKVKYIAPK
jgi:hypothetical protein